MGIREVLEKRVFDRHIENAERQHAEIAQLLGATSTRPHIEPYGPYQSGRNAEIIQLHPRVAE